MDLPEITTDIISNKLDNDNESLITSKSYDTGFVSDGTEDSLTQDNEKTIICDKGRTSPEPDDVKVDDEEKAEEDNAVTVGDGPSIKDEENQPEAEKEEESVDILGNGLLKKKVLVPGKGVQTRPNNGDIVTVKMCGKLENGTQVENEVISFILNDGDVIVALDLGVALMELGETCELFTSSRYAYGDLGRDPDIPKDASITFNLELIDTKPQADPSTFTFQERLQHGEHKRLRGNFLFGRADYSGAINSYSKAVKVLDDTDLNAGLDESDRAQLEDSWTKCYNNMAACQLKIDALDAAIRSAEKVLTAQPKNVKALFRIGKAYGSKGEVEKAISYLKNAIQLDPESKILHQELFALTKRKNKETESEKDLYRKMLGVKPNGKSSSAQKKDQGSSSLFRWVLPLGGLAAVVASVGFAMYRNLS